MTHPAPRVVCFCQQGPAASIPPSLPSFIISQSIQDASPCSPDVERNTASEHGGVRVHKCIFLFAIWSVLLFYLFIYLFFSQICNEKIAKGGGWGESSQRPPMPKVMGAIILRDVRDAGLSQSERMDNKYAKWVNALTHPPLQPPTPTHPSLHHILTNNQLDPRDSAVHLSRLGRYLALPKGMNVTRCV